MTPQTNTTWAACTGKTVVVKWGGSMAENDAATQLFLEQVAELAQAGAGVVMVHGGGKRVSAVMEQLGQTPVFAQGHRVTTPQNMAVVEWVLSGEANKSLVAGLCALGCPAVGLSGRDGELFYAEAKDAHSGLTGVVKRVKPGLLRHLLAGGFTPVISPVSNGPRHEAMNVNADLAAGALAGALGAQVYACLTDVDGVYEDLKRPQSLFATLTVSQIDGLMGQGVFDAGMIPKLQGACEAARGGVLVRIGGGQAPGGLGRLLLHPETGTTVTR